MRSYDSRGRPCLTEKVKLDRPRLTNAETLARALKQVTDFRLAIDGGAHVGIWTNLLCGHFGVVHAFEPSAETFAALVDEVAAAQNATLHNQALMDVEGYGEAIGNKSWARYVAHVEDGGFPIRTLDSFGFASCGLLKLDIEGAELLALRGAERLVDRFRPVIVVEVKRAMASRYGWKPDDLREWLAAKQYRLLVDSDPNKVYVP